MQLTWRTVWHGLGLQFLARCDGMRILALDGWEKSVGGEFENRYTRQLRIPIHVVDPDTYEWENSLNLITVILAIAPQSRPQT